MRQRLLAMRVALRRQLLAQEAQLLLREAVLLLQLLLLVAQLRERRALPPDLGRGLLHLCGVEGLQLVVHGLQRGQLAHGLLAPPLLLHARQLGLRREGELLLQRVLQRLELVRAQRGQGL